MDNSKTAVLMVFHSLPQAKIIEGLLHANGIECFLSNEAGMMLNPVFIPDNESIKLHVMAQELSTAREILTGKWQAKGEE